MKKLIIALSVMYALMCGRDNVPLNAAAEDELNIKKKLYVHYIDVGQGDSILIQTPENRNILIDCGDNGKGFDVAAYLKSRGINSIDALITTHPHADHIGGCDEVMQKIPVRHVYDNGIKDKSKSYKEYIALAKKTDYNIVSTDTTLSLDSLLNIELIVTYDTAGKSTNPNNNSVLVKLTYGNSSFLFTGDCEQECEAEAIATADLDADVLKAGHHGSATSTSQAFLNEVTPTIAVISVGTGNRYGHPSDQTLQRLSGMGILTYRTDLEHHVIVISDGDGYGVGE